MQHEKYASYEHLHGISPLLYTWCNGLTPRVTRRERPRPEVYSNAERALAFTRPSCAERSKAVGCMLLLGGLLTSHALPNGWMAYAWALSLSSVKSKTSACVSVTTA